MSRLLGAFTLIVALAGIDVRPGSAAESRLPEFLKRFERGQIFPGANRFGPVEGSPPAVAAFGGDRLLGYVYLNADVVNSTGYSGKPINIVVGIDLNGKIVGLQLAEHHEPIVLIGIPPAKITAFLEGYIGHNFLETPAVNNAAPPVDIIAARRLPLW
jgi:NosR/NirI family nitrous oxide reductase transcriptional regulator